MKPYKIIKPDADTWARTTHEFTVRRRTVLKMPLELIMRCVQVPKSSNNLKIIEI